jgi:uncharacterized membrane-anchored protein YitT (DUF2179 family)
MEKVIRYSVIVFACLLIAININFIIIPNNLISFGFDGIACLMYYINNLNPAINILLLNLIVLLLGYVCFDKNIVKYYLLPAILIPVMIFITSPLTDYFSFDLPEMLLVVIVSGVISGYSYGLIYKEGYFGGTIFLLEEIFGHITHFHSKIYSWVIDIFTLCILLVVFNYQVALYSLIIIIISKYMITKARFGINDSKMFFIITSKEKEVKNFIMHDLKYEFTVLDSKGGFTKKDNQILFTVISTSDYYRLKEGIKAIDEKAFIAITDTYDVVSRRK